MTAFLLQSDSNAWKNPSSASHLPPIPYEIEAYCIMIIYYMTTPVFQVTYDPLKQILVVGLGGISVYIYYILVIQGIGIRQYMCCLLSLSSRLETLEARRLVIAMLPKPKAWYLQNQINEKDQNALIEQPIQDLCKNCDKFLYDISSYGAKIIIILPSTNW